MALHITMNNVYRLYGMDSEQKIEGMVFLHQQNQEESIFNENTRLFDGLLLAFMLKGSMTTHIHFLEHEMHRGDVAILQPQLLIETKSLTQDAEIITIGLSLDFIASFPVLREFVMNDQIRWQPVIRLQEEEFLLRWTMPRLGEQKSIYYGLVFYALGLFLFAFANQGWMMFAFLLPYSLGGMCGPALQAVITKNIPSNEQGELQGALTSLASSTAIVGPPVMTHVFYFFTREEAPFSFSGAPFLLGSILMLVSVAIVYSTFKQKKE